MLFVKNLDDCHGQTIDAIIETLDTDVVVMQGDCGILALNANARAHMEREGLTDFLSCKNGYGSMFANLCEECPLSGEGTRGNSICCDVKDASGRIYSMNGGIIPWLDKTAATFLSLRNVDAQRDIEQKLYRLAYIDQLTGVFNRQKLREDFRVASSQQDKMFRCVMAILDIDHFKTVNDTYGHNTGDAMLKRLTGYFRGEPAYSEHLYRLGGDEFVLLYTNLPKHLNTEKDYLHYCNNLFKNVFFSYTMPNIALSCTISMGVSFAPFHGTSYSELLRKADIALYQAKETGRNRMVFFEEQYDAAKKFEDYYINIQPLLTGSGRTFGYELTDNMGGEASDDTLNLSELNRTIDSLGISDLNNSNKYIIAYSKQLESQSVSNYLPKDKFIIQIRLLPDGNQDHVMKLCKRLQELGYVLALEGLTEENALTALLEQADYFKFAKQHIDNWQTSLIAKYKSKSFIATRVDTVPTLEKARKAGFNFFQGNFFNKPAVVKKEKDIDPIKANYYRLLKLTGADEPVDFAQIANVISSDVALSYKLLRLLNSAAIGLRNRMTSIQMAVSYLGEETLKKWIALLALRGVASDKPLELVRMSLIRARFGEILTPHLKQRFDPNQVFMAGMFSLLHIALEKTKEELMQEIAVSEDIRESLLTSEGIYSALIEFFNHYEYSNWDEVTRFSDAQGLSSELIYNSYIEAVKWYSDLVEE